MILYVRYKDERIGHVNALFLDSLIRDREITMFYRPSERQWIGVGSGLTRKESNRHYSGAERRTRSL
jgi:hypothetical protein